MHNPNSEILALDVGERRIGVASATVSAMIAAPLATLLSRADIFARIAELLSRQDAVALVLGLPRGLDGQETAQTQFVRDFAAQLAVHVQVPLYWQDEALTSRKAEDELRSRNKPFGKGDIDALAATYILEDFLRDNPDPNHLPPGWSEQRYAAKAAGITSAFSAEPAKTQYESQTATPQIPGSTR